VPGVLVPGNEEVHLSGAASGSGSFNLSADKASALIPGQKISMEGLDTGATKVASEKGDGKRTSRVSFNNFYLKRLDWTKTDPKDAEKKG
jgi:hypothetical protein